MPKHTKKASQCDWLGKSRIVEVASTTFTAFRFSPLADCYHRLTIDVDDANNIAPTLLTQPPFFGRVLQSIHSAKPVRDKQFRRQLKQSRNEIEYPSPAF